MPRSEPGADKASVATLATVTARVLNLLGAEPSLSTAEAESIVQTRYEAIYETFSWSRRYRDFVISAVAPVTNTATTTITATNGSATITAAASVFTAGMTGRQIRIAGLDQYLFFTYVSGTSGTLSDGEGTSVTWPLATGSGLGWTIFKTIYTLPSNVQRVVSISHKYRLEEMSGGRYMLDQQDPMRELTSDSITHWCYAGTDSSNVREIEIWPSPTIGTILRGQATKEAPSLAAASTIDIPVPLLVYSAVADCCHLLASKQGSTEQMWTTIALFYERKAAEVEKEYRVVESDLSSPLTHLDGSSLSTMGGDWAVSHDTSL